MCAPTVSKPLIQPRVQGRNPARFKGGYGVPRGFKGEKSKSPPNPLGLAERGYSFHRCGGPPPSRREVCGFRRSRPPALPSIAYRGFAVAPITLRPHSTTLARFPVPPSPLPKTSLFEGGGPPAGGGRSPRAVEGVRGRWKESADGGRSPQTMIPPRSPTPHSSCEFGFFFICFICPKHMMFSSKTIRCPSGECRDHRHGFTANQSAIPAR